VVAQFPQEDAFYSFSSELLQRRTGDLSLLVLRRPTEFERVQRRRLYRLQANLDVLFTVAGSNEAKKAVTVDISGGGVCLTTAEKVDPGLELDLEIQLERASAIIAHGCVVKCSEIETPGAKPRYSLGVEFMNLPSPVQEQIVSFIFAKQRERRQREMGV
jgi:c-di-GMP-binding flagellar brake protein YcgR